MDTNTDKPNAADYVEWLLKHMLRSSKLELEIDTRRPLPGADIESLKDGPPCVPAPENVINRLKVLCGFSPVHFNQIKEGSFERPSVGHVILVSAKFNDGASSSCRIRMQVRAKKVENKKLGS